MTSETTAIPNTLRDAPRRPSSRPLGTRVSSGVGRWLIRLLLIVIGFVTLAPLVYMVVKSFTSQDGADAFTFAAWQKILTGDLPLAAFNSLVMCVLSIAIILVAATLAAFGFAKLPFRGSQPLIAGIIVLMLVPLQTYIITEYFNFSHLRLIGNMPAVAVIYGATQIPFATFILTNFFRSIPDEIVEAAIVDGASYPRVFWEIFVPLARPAMVTVGVLAFIGVWNDLLIALLFLPVPGLRTLSVVMASSQSTHLFDVGQLMAGSLLSAVPCIIVYLIFQRQIAVGLTAGTGK